MDGDDHNINNHISQYGNDYSHDKKKVYHSFFDNTGHFALCPYGSGILELIIPLT